ncbi:MAG: hypothetical protein PHR24_04040 [Oscillospiraceae bacterium]|nr:hypothetical protein [Oscillospiraceae bacterium]MDD3832652.1 hypothetical protein [Oscillospiraceae bacterium]MDD4546444.1 hypothetical protein [Oscillospiraceae bacterium]
MRDNQLKAVHPSDLKSLLKSLGIYNSVCDNKETCFFCHNVIAEDTISAVFPFENSVCFCCGNPSCCNTLIDLESEEDDCG